MLLRYVIRFAKKILQLFFKVFFWGHHDQLLKDGPFKLKIVDLEHLTVDQ